MGLFDIFRRKTTPTSASPVAAAETSSATSAEIAPSTDHETPTTTDSISTDSTSTDSITTDAITTEPSSAQTTRSNDMTTITIIGAGNMTRGIATRALAGGHTVQILARDASDARTLAAELLGTVTTGTIGDAVLGDIVVLALPYDGALAVAEQLREALAGKVVVDITNPVDFATFDAMVTPDDSSGAQEIAKLLPAAEVVKAFNTTFAGTLVAGDVAGQQLDVLVAADDAEAKAAVVSFVESSGMRALDAGPLKRAHQLEGMGFLHMALQGSMGNTWSTGVKVLGA